MKELHRPVNSKFMFAKDWSLLTDKERQKATEKGIIRLPTPGEFRKMTKEERKELRERFKPYIDEIKDGLLRVLKKFPPSLLLVGRLDNLINSFRLDD